MLTPLRVCLLAMLAVFCLPLHAQSDAGSIQFVPGTLRASEGDASVTLQVERVGGASGVAAIRLGVSGGTATQGQDYPAQAEVLSWDDGEAGIKQVAFALTDDDSSEGRETIFLRLYNPVGAGFGKYRDLKILLDDNDSGAGVLQFVERSTRFAEGTRGTRIAVERVSGSTGEASVRWAPTGGSATARVDFPQQGGLLNWANGETGVKIIELAVTDDYETEGRENIRLGLFNPVNAGLGSRRSHNAVILDDDADYSLDLGAGNCALAPGRHVIEQWTDQVGTTALGAGTPAPATHTLQLPSGCDIAEMEVAIQWDGVSDDLDMRLDQPGGASTVAESGNTGGRGVERIRLLDPASGDYAVEAYGYVSRNTTFRGTVTVDIGPPSACEVSFHDLPVGAGVASVDPTLDWDLPGDVVLSFASATGRDAALERLLQPLGPLSAAERQRAFAYRELHALRVHAEVLTPAWIESLRSTLDGLPLISFWAPPADVPLLNSSVPLIGVDDARAHFATAELGLQGAGVGVAIIDTGVDKTQGDLAGVVHNVRMLQTQAVEAINTETNEGHGTHIAGTIVGDGSASGGQYRGVAPASDVVGIAVDVGAPYLFSLEGIDYVLTQRERFNIRVSNHSYGPGLGSGFRFDPTSASSLAIKQLYDAGVIPVFAAGNLGPANDTIGPDAQHPCVISVANGDRNYELADSSSRGTPDNTTAPGPDITAPGTRITASRALNGATSTPLANTSNPRYATISGTSMAAPHVVGVIALMLEANPALDFEGVYDILQSTARAMPGYQPHEVGAGYVDALGAVAAALQRNKPQDGYDVDVSGGATRVYERSATAGTYLGVLCTGCPAEGGTIVPHAFDFVLPASLNDVEQLRFVVRWQSAVDQLGLDVYGPDNDSALRGSSYTLASGMQEVVLTPQAPANAVATGRYRIEVSETLLNLGAAFTVEVDVVRADAAPTRTLRSTEFQRASQQPAQCADGVDNDGDGLTDLADPGCSSSIDDDETDPPPPSACSNGLDDDGDGWTDMQDAGCSASADNDETDAGTTQCSNGLDDDGDGAIDAADSGCADGRDTSEGGAPPPSCTLPAGEQVLHSFSGMVGTAALYAAPLGGNTVTENVQVALPAGCTATAVTVEIRWDLVAEDLDLEVDAHGRTETAARTQLAAGEAAERVSFAAPEINGDYVIRTQGFVSADTPFEGEVRVTIAAGGTPPNNAARVIVSVLDTGTLPYHDYFHAGSPIYANAAPSAVTPAVLAELGIGPSHQIELTRTGNFAADYAADAAIWANIQPGELYWFKGTNLIAVSYDSAPGRRPILPDPGDTSGEHGVGTAAAVLQANPEAIVLFVEFGASIGDAQAESLGFLHPSVDIVSTSYGFQDPVLGTGLPLPFTGPAAEAVIDQGKMHFSSAANSADPFTPEAGGAGPWWTVAIAGIEEGSSEGRTTVSGYFIDFVSDFTQQLPYCFECESGLDDRVSGTSFATPRSAGVASKVLLEARRSLGHVGGIRNVGGQPVLAAGLGQSITTWQLRRALEVGAYVDRLEDYNPVTAVFDLGAQPPIDAAPWATLGWGNLSALPDKAVVAETLAQLGFGSGSRTKAAEFCDFQTANIRRRKTYWDAPGPGWFFNSYDTPADDPFLYCGSVIP